jgi:uncharacterized protein
MGLPRKLKQMMMYVDGIGYAAETTSVTLPKLGRKFEAYRGGAMDSAVKIDLGGLDDLDLEHSYGGPVRALLRQYGVTTVGGLGLRFVGAFQNDDSGTTDSIEVAVRGRHEELDMGESKPGESGEFKVKTACSYYKLLWNGATEIEIDKLNNVLIVGGIDRLAEIRAALGQF